MIKLDRAQYHYWRNAFAPIPVMVADVTLSSAIDWTISRLSAPLLSTLRERLPGAIDETKAQDAAELIAAIAQRAQLAGDVVAPLYGVPSRDLQTHAAKLFFSCNDPHVGAYTLTQAVSIVDGLTRAAIEAETLAKILTTYREHAKQSGLFITTRKMLEAADRNGIPWLRTAGTSPYATLGQGFRQHHLVDTILGPESAIGRDLTRNKKIHLEILSRICLPVGKVVEFGSVDEGLRAAEYIGYPLVVKPTSGGRGTLVFVNLRSANELRLVLEKIPLHQQRFIVQSFFPGDDHRMLVVNGKLVAAVVRIPASVIGDGQRNIVELVEIENRNPHRVNGPMKYLVLDEEADRVLAQQGLTCDSVPETGLRVFTRGTANIATGGSAINVTHLVHPDNARAAVRAAKALELTVAGVDLICPDISRSWRETGGGICEVNSHPGLQPHTLTNPDQDITGTILESVYPIGDDGRIPTAMVTGTMGQTTICFMLNSILTCGGHMVGMATSEGVTIGSEMVQPGDLAGPMGHAIVLRDPLVTAAVLETARGGLVKMGMYLDRCDVAVLTNVDREQIGMNGIETPDDIARLKRKVLDAARKAVVLNADYPRCLALAGEFAPRIRTILFSRKAESDAVREHLGRGGEAIYLASENDHEWIIAAKGAQATRLMKSGDLSSTADGMFWPQASNAMAATALALGLGISPEIIVEGLMRYGRDFPAAKGRLSVAEGVSV